MKTILLSLAIGLAGTPRLGAADESAKAKDIRKLLVMTGSAQLAEQMLARLVGSFKQAVPSVPAKFWDDFVKQVKADELVGQIVPVYDKYLTHEEVKALIAFYESPVGKKYIQVLPQITQESMTVGEAWGRQLGERAARQLQEEQQRAQQKQEALEKSKGDDAESPAPAKPSKKKAR
jgi:hypothetical protein